MRCPFPKLASVADFTEHISIPDLDYASQRPNATGISPVTSGSLEARLNNYINPLALSTAPQFTFGNVAGPSTCAAQGKPTGICRCSRLW